MLTEVSVPVTRLSSACRIRRGMLALGATHPEDALWAVTAFVRQLPTMTPEEYQAMAQRYEAKQSAGASGAPPAAGRGMKPSGPEARP